MRISDWSSYVCSSDLVLQAARQPVELPDDDDISLAQLPDHLQELGSVPSLAASGLLEYTFAAERVERAPLRGVRLVVALRHAGIADQIGFARHPASFTNGRIRRWKQDAPISAALGLSQSSFIKRAKGKRFLKYETCPHVFR